jgi:preprotein translocase subunit SecA
MNVIDWLNRLLGDPNEKELKRLRPVVPLVREHQKSNTYQSLKLEDLPKKTEEFRGRIQTGETLDALLPEAFALVIRACELLQGKTMEIGRQTFTWNMVPFDVQIIGGAVLHRGNIAEMKTGEGKTLVCTMPVYLNALAGKGVHVITVNDYLARRDSRWMGLLYESLGMKVGTIVHGLNAAERRAAYACDITYGTNNEFGFDYLRDNMATARRLQVQRGLHYAIVDEVDSILIDEARTPLIISQPAAESTTKYVQYARLVRELKESEHYNKDEKQRAAALTEEGVKKMEQLLGIDNIYTEKGFEEVHHIEQALRAHAIYQRDVDYVVKDGQIIIVDEFTGRLMPGRRYGHGLHQAIEAKENVEVQRESKTLATITFQNYFRLYDKLAGMTGTAKTEEEEFESIYRLRTIVAPTHRPMVRQDLPDAVYRTMGAKFKAVAKMAKEKHALGQPILIGTTSIEKSEILSKLLEQEGIKHEVLNAKNHEREAEIVSLAGQKGAVTIATNMAGRGTDIKLGDGVQELGGLAILGTERHESRRIDNQLRGRSGRQGDPGESRFFVSMEDELMRLFGGDRLKTMMERLKVPDDQPLQNPMVSRSIESAQKRVEGHHFDVRKHVLQYDDVMNKHRDIIYRRRQRILEKLEEADERRVVSGQKSVVSNENKKEVPSELTTDHSKLITLETSLHHDILASMEREADALLNLHAAGPDSDAWNIKEIYEIVRGMHPGLEAFVTLENMESKKERDELKAYVYGAMKEFYAKKCAQEDPASVALAERVVTLRSIDTLWMDHIDDMAHLREQVAFSGFAQRDPLIEYQDRGFRKFQLLLNNIESSIVRTLLQIDFKQFAPRQVLEQAEEGLENLTTNEAEIEGELTKTGVGREASSAAATLTGGDLLKAPPAPGTRPGPTVRLQPRPIAPPAASAKQMPQVGRNDPCPCGSGKKFKKCHGKDA